MKKLYSAGTVVYRITPDGVREYLLLHYPHGHWDLPKGKIEAEESKQEAALRELHEETGLEAKLHEGFEEEISYIFTDHDGQLAQKAVYFFVGQVLYDQSEVTLSHEHIGHAWLPFEQALAQLTYKNAQQVLQKAHGFLSKN